MSYQEIRPLSRQEWLNERAKGIGSSEAGAILGVNKYDSAWAVWARKKGKEPPKAETLKMRCGHYLEDGVAREFALATRALIDENSVGDWIARCLQFPFLQVSPDRLYREYESERLCILECKTTSMDIDPEDVPQSWYVQLQYQMWVMGIEHGAVAWIIDGGKKFGFKEFDRNDVFCEYLIKTLTAFWTRYIVGDEEPLVATPEDVAAKYPTSESGKQLTAEDEDIKSWIKLRQIKDEVSSLEAQKKELEERIKARMGSAEALIDGAGNTLVTFKSGKDRQTFDSKAFGIAHPDLYAQYVKTTSGSRMFLVKN